MVVVLISTDSQRTLKVLEERDKDKHEELGKVLEERDKKDKHEVY